MVAWLSDGQRQEETQQDPKVGLLRDNGSHAHYSHQCCGSTYLPPPPPCVWGASVGRGRPRLHPGDGAVGITYIPIEDTAVF